MTSIIKKLTHSMVLFGAMVFTFAYAAEGGGGRIDLTESNQNGAGIGFIFTGADAMQAGKALVSRELPKCKIGPLDAVYFYVYGCEVASEFVLSMIDSVGDGFLYTSDKSLTLMPSSSISQSSLLLANAWDMQLAYTAGTSWEATAACEQEFELIGEAPGCVAASSCSGGHTTATKLNNTTNGIGGVDGIAPSFAPSLTVGCGSLSCTGCVLTDFFAAYRFDEARFISSQR